MLAQEEARLLNHGFIGTEHVLLGLVHEGEGVAAKALEQHGISLGPVREKVEEIIGRAAGAPTGSPPFTPRTKKVLELSFREAMQLGHEYINTEHLLLGIIREGEGVAVQVLVSRGVALADLRQTVVEMLSSPSVGSDVQAGRSGGWVSYAPGQAPLVRCSFCGRHPPATGRLVAAGAAVICEHCVRDWHQRLEGVDELPSPSSGAHLVDITEQEPEEK